jgi:hypothetical protein
MGEKLAALLAGFAEPSYLWIIFGIELAAFAVVSAMLVYHWKSYTIDERKVRRILRFYFGGAGALLAVKAAALLLFSLS